MVGRNCGKRPCALMLFDVVFIFPETTLLSLLQGDWNLTLLLLDGGGFGVRGPMFIGAVYHGTYVLVKKNQFLEVLTIVGMCQ